MNLVMKKSNKSHRLFLVAAPVLVVLIGLLFVLLNYKQVNYAQDLSRVPFPYSQVYVNEPLLEKPEDFKSSHSYIPFHFESQGRVAGTKNTKYAVYIDQTYVGEIEAQSIITSAYYPLNKRYVAFIFRKDSGCSEACTSFEVKALDLQDKRILPISAPHKKTESGNYAFITTFVPQISFSKPDKLQLLYFEVGTDEEKNSYRISPKEVWQYEFINASYSFIRNCSDESICLDGYIAPNTGRPID